MSVDRTELLKTLDEVRRYLTDHDVNADECEQKCRILAEMLSDYAADIIALPIVYPTGTNKHTPIAELKGFNELSARAKGVLIYRANFKTPEQLLDAVYGISSDERMEHELTHSLYTKLRMLPECGIKTATEIVLWLRGIGFGGSIMRLPGQ